MKKDRFMDGIWWRRQDIKQSDDSNSEMQSSSKN